MKVGYIGVSTAEQNMGRQEILMREIGVEKVFIDKCSGKPSEARRDDEFRARGRYRCRE